MKVPSQKLSARDKMERAGFTERDLFISNHPQALLRDQTRTSLESRFGRLPAPTDQEYIELLLDTLYKKYQRIDLVKWDPDPNETFYDHRSGHYLSLGELERRLDEYSPMALQRLQGELDLALRRWGRADEFLSLRERIREKNDRVLRTRGVTD